MEGLFKFVVIIVFIVVSIAAQMKKQTPFETKKPDRPPVPPQRPPSQRSGDRSAPGIPKAFPPQPQREPAPATVRRASPKGDDRGRQDTSRTSPFPKNSQEWRERPKPAPQKVAIQESHRRSEASAPVTSKALPATAQRAQPKTAQHPLVFNANPLVNGIIISEILQPPLARRRR